jgi:hypothetical protein
MQKLKIAQNEPLKVAKALGDYYMILDEYKIIYSNTFIVQLYNVCRITYLIRLLVLNRDLLFLFDHDLLIRSELMSPRG